METKPPDTTIIERVDDVPLILAQLQEMEVAPLLDKHFEMHGNWQGLSFGQVVVIWLAYILSTGDHRMNSVQGWAAGLLMTLSICLDLDNIRELDFSDDRLSLVLDVLGRDDAAWEDYEREQTATLLRVYDLKPRRIRIDSTTAKSHVAVTEGGLFQFGHSKEHRPELPQLKINQSVLDPLGLPLSTTIVSGESADDPLYVPEIRKVQAQLDQPGVLYVGDCKMGALDTRTYIVASGDHYLCPLSAVQMPMASLQEIFTPVLTGEQELFPVYRPSEGPSDKPVMIARGFSYLITLKAGDIEWQEQRLVVQSLKYAETQQEALDERLRKAEKEIAALNKSGRGRKRLNAEEVRTAVEAILRRRNVAGLLIVEYHIDTQTTRKRAYGSRPAREVTTETVTVLTSRDAQSYEEAVRYLGWRVYVSNDLELSLPEAVLAYRDGYIIERGFNRYRGKLLGLTPFFISSTTRIKGLIRLLSIGLRVLFLIEFKAREALREKEEKLDGIYPGNPKRSTARPTTEMMLKTFQGINMVIFKIGDTCQKTVSQLNAVQSRILGLLGFDLKIYQGLGAQFG